MCFVVNSILEQRAKEKGIMRPQLEERVKTFDSLLEKIARKKKAGRTITNPFEDIDDFAGVRFICYFFQDLDTIKECILSGEDILMCTKLQKLSQITLEKNY